MFLEKKLNNKRLYYSDFLEEYSVEHFFTSRDFSFKSNIDDKKEICKYLDLKLENLIKPTQTHSDNVEIFSENKKNYPDCDGLILKDKNYGIYLNFADCTPIILYDTKNNIASIVHAGWRGTVSKIGVVAIKKMQENFKTKQSDIIAIIGPCISFKNFETSNEVIENLKGTIEDKTNLFSDRYADLKGINAQQLKEFGVKKIDICPYCTVDDNDKFYSYRKENKTIQRHSAIARLK